MKNKLLVGLLGLCLTLVGQSIVKGAETRNPEVQDIRRIETLTQMIRRHEGTRERAYTDTRGNRTIGVGFNLERADARQTIQNFGLNYNEVYNGRQELSEAQVNTLLQRDIRTATQTARNYLGQESFTNLPQEAQNIITDMAFNLGANRLRGFRRLRTALQNRDYEKANNLPRFRHRIEHVQIIDQDDLRRLASLDIIASIQPIHCPSDMNMAEKYLGLRTRNAYAYRNMIESGTDVVLGSDAPVEPINPFLGIHAAVTRRRSDGSPGPDGWHPEQRLSLEQAIVGFSHTPAKIANRGSRLGKIAPGFKADFLILNEDPFQIDSEDLWKIKPESTFIEGECVYQSPSISLNLSNT